MTRPLLNRPPRRPAESLPSYLSHLAEVNDYPASTMVVRLCRDQLSRPDMITQPTRLETYQVLARLTQRSVDDLYLASVHRFATTLTPPTVAPFDLSLPTGETRPLLPLFFLREHTWPQTGVQFCPRCLQIGAYHRVHWLPLAVAVCLDHQCLLVRDCPACTRALSVTDLLKDRCPGCQLILSQVAVTSVSQDGLGLFSQTAIQAWFGLGSIPEAKPIAVFSALAPAVRFRVLDGLRWAIMHIHAHWDDLYQPGSGVGQPLFPCLAKHDITPAKAYRLYATAFKALLAWPQGFEAFLESYRKRDDRPLSPYLQQELGPIYTACLQQRWRHPAFQVVQDAFAAYLCTYFPAETLARLRRVEFVSP